MQSSEYIVMAKQLRWCECQQEKPDKEWLSGTCNNLKESMHYKYKRQAILY